MIVEMFREFVTLFLTLLGSPESPFIEMHCSLVWLGMLARSFLVKYNDSIYLGPESASLGCLRMKCSASTRRIQLHNV